MTYQTGSTRPANLRARAKEWKKRAYGSSMAPEPPAQSIAESQPTEQSAPEVRSSSPDLPSQESEDLPSAKQTPSTAHWGPPFDWMETATATTISYFHPLHSALVLGDEDKISQLIDGGANPNARTSVGLTPLHIAVREGKQNSCIQELVDAGAVASFGDVKGNTALHWAVRWHWSALLDFATTDTGAIAIHIKNQDGFTPWHLVAIAFRKGLLAPGDITYLMELDPEHHALSALPTGETLAEHLIETLWYGHLGSSIPDRMNWWGAMISNTSERPGLEFVRHLISWSLGRGRSKIDVVPKTDVSLLTSFLKDLPILELSQDKLEEIVFLGYTLLRKVMWHVHQKGPEPPPKVITANITGALIHALIEAQCAGFWNQHPERVQEWIEYLVDRRHRHRIHETDGGWGNGDLLIRAISGVKLAPGKESNPAAFALVSGGWDAFTGASDGRIPLVEALERQNFLLVEAMLEENLKRNENEQDESGVGELLLGPRLHWTEWEDAKVETWDKIWETTLTKSITRLSDSPWVRPRNLDVAALERIAKTVLVRKCVRAILEEFEDEAMQRETLLEICSDFRLRGGNSIAGFWKHEMSCVTSSATVNELSRWDLRSCDSAY